MVFNSLVVLTVAHVSADSWQSVLCVPTQERFSSQQLLDLVCCLPLQQLGRFALCLWTFLCLPHPDSFYSYSTYYDSSDSDYDIDDNGDGDGDGDGASSSSTIDLEEYYYHPRSD